MKYHLDKIVGAKVVAILGLKYGSHKVEIVTDRGTLEMYHNQGYGEDAQVEDVTPDAPDIVGKVIVAVEEREQEQHNDRGDNWTFYEFTTNDSSMTIRWCGYGGTYYSVSIDTDWLPQN